MSHLHELFDFVVSAFIIYQDKVLLIHHKQLNSWLPVGGHIELDEDPQQALFREVQEESGLSPENLIVLSDKLDFNSSRTKFLFTPNHLDVHQINPQHKHIGLIYFLTSNTSQIQLAQKEHHDIKWFSNHELSSSKYQVFPEIQMYARKAMQAAQSNMETHT